MPDRPTFSIVIPTRERHRTLEFAIRSVLEQPHDDYELVVMDNFSSPETRQVVDRLANRHLRYVRAPERLTMADNWELGLAQATGEYVFILGDDDALAPDGIELADRLLRDQRVPIISWLKSAYWWPDAIVPWHRDRLYVNLDQSVRIYESRSMLRLYWEWKCDYGPLPGIYNSFVHRDVIARVKAQHGRYFLTMSPDVMSGVVNARFTDRYLLSARGLSLTGNSGSSTGTSFVYGDLSDGAAAMFKRETGHWEDLLNELLVDSPSLEICFAYENLRLKRLFFPDDAAFEFDPATLLRAMAANVNRNPGTRDRIIDDMGRLAARFGLAIPTDAIPPPRTEPPRPVQGPVLQGAQLAINCAQAGVSDACAAARLAHAVLPAWR